MILDRGGKLCDPASIEWLKWVIRRDDYRECASQALAFLGFAMRLDGHRASAR